MPTSFQYKNWYPGGDLQRRLDNSFVMYKGKWYEVALVRGNSIYLSREDDREQRGHKILLDDPEVWKNLTFPLFSLGNFVEKPIRFTLCTARQYKWGINMQSQQSKPLFKNNHQLRLNEYTRESIIQTLERKYQKFNIKRDQSLSTDLSHSKGMLKYKFTTIGLINNDKTYNLLPRFNNFPIIVDALEELGFEQNG